MRRLHAHSVEFAEEPRMLVRRESVATEPAPDLDAGPPEETAAFKQAYLEGFEAGYADGDKEARRQLQDAESAARSATESASAERALWQRQVVALAASFADARARQLAEMEELAVEIAFAATCRILGRAHAERRLTAAMCGEVLAAVRHGPTQLRVAEDDLPTLEELGVGVDVIADPRLRAGDCIVSTPRGDRDGGIEAQLDALRAALLDTLRRGDGA